MKAERPKCLRCGKTLPRVDNGKGKQLGHGYAATGLFCSLTCGHWFAVDIVKEAARSELTNPKQMSD